MKRSSKIKLGIGIFFILLQMISYSSNNTKFLTFPSNGDSLISWAQFLGYFLGFNLIGILGFIFIIASQTRKKEIPLNEKEKWSESPSQEFSTISDESKTTIEDSRLYSEVKNQPATKTEINDDINQPIEIRFQKTISTAQKIILSITAFSVLLIICYVWAENMDYRMKLNKTWYIWVGFIIIQAWLQNRFWSLKDNFAFSIRIPYFNRVRNYLRKYQRPIYTLISILFIALLLTFIIKIIEENKLRQQREIQILLRREEEKIRKEEEEKELKEEKNRRLDRYAYILDSLKAKEKKKKLEADLRNSNATTYQNISYAFVSAEYETRYINGLPTTKTYCISDVIKINNYTEETEYRFKESARTCSGYKGHVIVTKYKTFKEAADHREILIKTASIIHASIRRFKIDYQ